MSIRKMISLHPKANGNQALGDAVHHLMYCAKMCASCADASMAATMDMVQCIRLCLDCSDICDANPTDRSRAFWRTHGGRKEIGKGRWPAPLGRRRNHQARSKAGESQVNVVVDTNVIVSGVFFGGPPHVIMDAWRRRKFEIRVTPSILDEYRSVVAEFGSRSDPDLASTTIDALTAYVILGEEEPVPLSVCRDADDEKFLACAAATGAILVSGDKDLLSINGALGVTILSPRAVIARHLA